MIKICDYSQCRKAFNPKHRNQRYCCPECKRLGGEEKRKARVERIKAEERMHAQAAKNKMSAMPIAQVAQLARKEGLSYGQYVEKYAV